MLKKIIKTILEIVFPLTCVGCGKPNTLICDDCVKNIKSIDNQECPNCRKQTEKGEFCSAKCKNTFLGEPSYFSNLIVCSRYDKQGTLKKIIEEFKYHYSENLAEILGSLLKSKLASPDNNFIIVPVPLHSKRQKARGFNQAELLAKTLNLETKDALIRIKNTKQQAHLNKKERLTNVKNAFALNPKYEKLIQNKNVILLDDVCTTGSTLNECAKALKGASKIEALVLARGH